MPNSTKGVRSGSSKRSDQRQNGNLDSPTRRDLSRRTTDEPKDPFHVLGRSSAVLRQLARLAQYCEAFTDDIQAVEDACGTEIEKQDRIRILNETVETLTHSKSEEMEKLRLQNKGLLAEQAACQEAKKESLEIKEKLKAYYAKVDADRQEEGRQKVQEEKAKFEEEAKKKVEEWKNKHAKLSGTNMELVKRCSVAEENLKTKKTRHNRELKGLEDENEKLKEERDKIKSEFPIEGKSMEY